MTTPTPLTAEEEAALRTGRLCATSARLLATLDAARAGEGLDGCRRLGTGLDCDPECGPRFGNEGCVAADLALASQPAASEGLGHTDADQPGTSAG